MELQQVSLPSAVFEMWNAVAGVWNFKSFQPTEAFWNARSTSPTPAISMYL